MVKRNDRWSQLSMKQRADLIKLYTDNDITSLDTIKKDYNSFAPGGPIETDEYGYPADITPAVVTQDSEFNKFLMTLPDNQRLTPEEDYHTYQYWKINGKPKDFSEALNLGMYHYDSSDNSYHANSVAFDSKGVGHFMKPKHHPTVKYELDWYNKGTGTLEGGEQYPLQGEERKEWEDFRSQYQLDSTGVDYKYVPRRHYNSFGDGGSSNHITEEEYMALQADNKRKEAYQTSIDTKEVRVPLIKLTEKDIQELETELVTNENNIKRYKLNTAPYWQQKQAVQPYNQFEKQVFNQEWYNATVARNEEIKKLLQKGCRIGSSCTYHSTGHYGPEYQFADSDDFVNTNGNGAFVEVPKKDTKSGDIVISFRPTKEDSSIWEPHHTLMFSKWGTDGYPRYNSSNGGTEFEDLRWDKLYNITDSTRTYRFTGNTADKERWSKEYKVVNKKADGGDTSEKDIYIGELPGVVVTPNGNYVKYSSNNKDVSFEDYKESRVQQDRINAVNNILNQESPLVPQVPNLLARALIKAGFSENFATKLCGYAKNPHTCIYTATGMYPKGSQVAGNKTFADSYTDYGFEKVDNIQKGDMLQLFNGNGVPYHAVMVTGFAEDGSPLLSYANGHIDRDLNKNGILDESEKNMRYNKNNLYDDGDDNTPDFAIARDANEDEAYDIFRYVGNPEQINTYFKEYKKMYGNKNKK